MKEKMIMKKLVTVFAACAIAGMAMALDSNIVGYTTKDVAANQKVMSGAQFVEVGEAGLDLASIRLEGVPTGGSVFIDWWNGSTYTRATWVDEVDDIEDNVGWGEPGSWAAVSHTFEPGEGFWITVPNVPNAKVTQSGEVALSKAASFDYTLSANTKFMLINPLPTDISLSDIKLAGVPTGGSAFIDWWNGSAYTRATWVDEVDDIEDNIGWGAPDSWAAVSHTFKPADGFWILIPGGGSVVTPQVIIANKVVAQ